MNQNFAFHPHTFSGQILIQTEFRMDILINFTAKNVQKEEIQFSIGFFFSIENHQYQADFADFS